MASSALTDLLSEIPEGHILLLPNARAARNLRRTYDEHQRAAGLTAWLPANALSWQQGMTSLYANLIVAGAESRLLLNEAQEHSVWLEVIDRDQADGLADLARSAFHLAAQHNATAQLRASATTHDARLFAEWADSFTKRCASRDLVSTALLDYALCRHAQQGSLPIPAQVHLVGFGPLNPSQAALLEAFDNLGSQIHHHTLSHPPADAARHTLLAPTERQELTLATHYLRNLFDDPNPPKSVAVILAESTPETLSALESTFREVLAPELQTIAADLSSTPWEFSSNPPLATIPLVAAAFDLAHWSAATLPIDRITALLLNPYLGQPGDRDNAARFDAQVLRRTPMLRPETDLRTLLDLAATQTERALAPSWLVPLQQAISRAGDLSKARGFADWTEFFRGLTRAAAWPGPRSLTASEFEATQAWDAALDLLATLDFAGRRVSLATALQSLGRQLARTPFTPPATNAPIQILTPDEATGSVFDAVLFLRAIDRNWPRTQRANPLIGWSLQQSLRMPGTDPALDTAIAQLQTESLLNRTATVLFTSAAEDATGKQRPSPLVAALNLPPLDPAAPEPPPAPISLEAIVDATPIPALPSPQVRGGAKVLKLQAACGFLAFSELRLHSTPIDAKSPGFDLMESGNFLHRAMQEFWRLTTTQQDLRAMTTEAREDRLMQCIDVAVNPKIKLRSDWDRAYLQLQKDRLRIVLQQWLDAELERTRPFTVVGLEQDTPIQIGPLTLRVRMDRVEQVDGGTVFVDYKTGASADPNQWDTLRPDDPQLPLYALATQPGELKAITFARVRAGKGMAWAGYQAEDGILPAKRGNLRELDSLIEEWRATLAQLAEDFASGHAHVNPKDFAVNCTRCAQRLLCRINPEAFLAQIDDDADLPDGDGE